MYVTQRTSTNAFPHPQCAHANWLPIGGAVNAWKSLIAVIKKINFEKGIGH